MLNRPFHAYLDQMDIITIILPPAYYSGRSDRFFLERGDDMLELEVLETDQVKEGIKYSCRSPIQPEFGRAHTILDERFMRTDLQIGTVVRTPEFDEAFYYGGADLGASYTPERTCFRVWAPTATEVLLKYKRQNSSDVSYLPMTRIRRGVYEAAVAADLEGACYRYHVCVNNQWHETGDPYAKAVSLHSEWSCIIDERKTAVLQHSLPPLSSPLDAIIYEGSIRDFSMHPDSGVKQKGKYLAFTERRAAGISYLKELGITHLELLPFNDFYGISDIRPDANYNWGYNPLYFNVPEGSYSSNPKDPYCRIRELKNMIEALHQAGIRVIMDAVYNHVYMRETSDFERLVPGYYFRQDSYGRPSNGTGVGNDFASERKMARKFILDSLKYWLTAYNVDGFRFDLMGILDVETMKEACKIADRYKPGCLLLGEGWELNTALPKEKKANLSNQAQLPNIAQFNDWFRDVIKGSTFHLYDRGYALGRESLSCEAFQVAGGSIGIGGRAGLFLEPGQSVNYVESHDNYTLWDKLEACFPEELEKNKKRHRLATAFVLLSQGIPFLHSGQEFFRTKYGVENSYASPDAVNQLDWNRKEENRASVEYIKGLIQVRKEHQAFRLRTAQEIRRHLKKGSEDHGPLVLLLTDVGAYGPWQEIMLIFHPSEHKSKAALPSRATPWQVIVSGASAGIEAIAERTDFIEVEPISCAVCVR
ncbi:type I pullulanase [Bacillus xiapuensis]|uniref:type I pullulanase n=1 Tax=Bacillus xiapuensis TaxID=2014075 RepID=UPI000C2380C0|nr:type I pullulanase [Bacillus xiapuensis]